MQVLVTGNNGFIGRSLTDLLKRNGHEVVGVERYIPTYGLEREVPTYYGEIQDYQSIKRIIGEVEPDAIIHLAAMSSNDQLAYDNWQLMLKINGIGTANIAEAARSELGGDLKLFISASSSEVYGDQAEFPLTEDMKLRPNSPYSTAKIQAENYLQYLYDAYGFPCIIIRPFNTYGYMNRRTVIESIIKRMKKGGRIRMGDPDAVRDFLFIDDHCEGYLRALEKGEDYIGETYNLSTNRPIEIRELADMIGSKLDFEGDIEWNSFSPRPNDIQKLLGSYKKAFEDLGWEPLVDLEEGIQMVIDAWRE